MVFWNSYNFRQDSVYYLHLLFMFHIVKWKTEVNKRNRVQPYKCARSYMCTRSILWIVYAIIPGPDLHECVSFLILGNPGVTHSVPTALMNAVGTEWVTPGLPRMVFSSFAIILTRKREGWLLCFNFLPDVLYLFVFCCSTSWCRVLVCSVWLWYFLIILTYFLKSIQ